MKDRHEQDRQLMAQGSLPALLRRREEFYSTQFQRVAVDASPVWNGTDNRFGWYWFLFRARGASSDWKSRSRKRSLSQRSGNARLLSHRFNRRLRTIAQMFSFGSTNGATGPELTVSGGVFSGTGVGFAANEGCLMRVAINIALKSSAAAR